MSTREVVKLVAYILLAIGTVGLLVNEFTFDCGRSTTLTFGIFNLVGLAVLAFTRWGMRRT